MTRSRIGFGISVATLMLVSVAVVRHWAGHWVVFVVLAGMAVGYGVLIGDMERAVRLHPVLNHPERDR